ncbi:cation-translocating P-type ATPase [Mycolicibacterium austroafricanum]|uniref:cation-translocating P-type ATPase n=1 Tax=Mycolicibacterium austroafricanum TaxID=39687 RepID=UPI001CA379DE|nr:cation-translocating P-type ATPase [Mycolicibacterium austroafricanum]QZT60989.1 cation-translocating P-type ATPase [Mycolicibacterium austroafricanum]
MTSVVDDTDPSLLDCDTVVERLGSDAERGLSTQEAARRLVEVGPNEITAEPAVPRWRKFIEQFRDPLIYLLFVAIVISLIVWAVEGASGWPVDAVVIAAIVVANAVLGYAQRAHAERAVEALMRMSAATATVVRDGVQKRVPTRELVPGDVLVLAEGDTVAADARLLSASTLQVAEAPLTGESEPVLKDARTLTAPAALGDRLDMVFNGSAVNRGVGRAVVTATAMATQMGQIVVLLRAVQQEPTPLQLEIARLGRVLGIAVLSIAVVVIAAVLVVFGVDNIGNVVTALLLGVSLAVAAVPEGLPAIMSVVLALGVRRMAARNAIVKDLSSVETLGSASVVCSDKTGTLTTGEMTIGRIVTPVGEVTVTGAGYRPDGRIEQGGDPLADDGELGRQCALVLGIGSLANDATVQEQDGEWTVQGDPTEAAFLVAERKTGTGYRQAGRFSRVGEIPFTSERKLMTSVESDSKHGGRIVVLTKGAPEVLLERCSHVQVGERTEPLDEVWKKRVIDDVERLSGDAYRTLSVAYLRLQEIDPPEIDESLEHDLVYAGMVGIIDPPRPEAAAAIAQARGAGIRIVMITGDHPRTAARIARDLGLTTEEPAVSGVDLVEFTEDQFRETVRRRSVYARVSPADKQRIVDALHADHHVVAMTGDGVNDAPALKAADIGVAMGRSGTEVAKEAAKMILADDNFATIVNAIREGRGIFSNIRKFLRYLLSSNMGEVLTVFLGVVLARANGLSDGHSGIALPLLATQILWINLLTDSGPALAMGVDRETEDVMNRPPRSLSDRIIDARMWGGIVVTGVIMALATLLTIDLYLPGGLIVGEESLDNARTAGFTVLVLAQLFNSLNARSETGTAFRRLFANPWLWVAIAVSALLQVAVVHLPFLQHAFSTEPLTLAQWAVCIAMASTVLWVSEIRKLVLRFLDRRNRVAGHANR